MKRRFKSKSAYKKIFSGFRDNFNKYERYFKDFSKFCGKIFSILLPVFLIILFIEQFFGNSLERFLNINIILVILIASGSFYAISTKEKEIEPQKYEIKRKDILFIILLGIIGSVLIWFKTKEYGPISYYISIMSGFIITILLYYVLKGE